MRERLENFLFHLVAYTIIFFVVTIPQTVEGLRERHG